MNEDSTVKNKFRCCICEKSFEKNKTLRYHIRKKHADADVNVIAPPVTWKQKENSDLKECSACNKKFTAQKYLRVHAKKIHNIELRVGEKDKTCPMCVKSFSDLDAHFENQHDIIIESEDLNFSTFEDFRKWKKDTEMKTTSFFAKINSHKLADGGKSHTYICNRSGIHKSKSAGIRRMKIIGSRRIGGICPARIKATVGQDGKNCSVKFIKTHIGHTNQVEFIKTHIGHTNQVKFIKTHIGHTNQVKLSNQKIKSSNVNTLEESKNNIIKELTDIIKKLKSQEELEAVKKIIAPINPTLKAMQIKNASFSSKTSKVPANKKIEPQRYFPSTKKSCKRAKGALLKPTQEEAETIAASFFLTQPIETDDNQLL